MATETKTILLKQGLDSQLPVAAGIGEPLFTTDTHRVFVGFGSGKIELLKVGDVSALQYSQCDNNIAIHF
jgi:uridylate kinase